MNAWRVALVPFAVSIGLSAATVGAHPFWQDSGLYLTGIRELGILYPPGFALYEVLCRAWTRLLFFVDFTLAVHLFSSLCAALASGTLAIGVRDFLRSRAAFFKVVDEDPGPSADAAAVVAGVILACGFSFWSTAIYAKGYALYYLVLALLAWRMIRAEEDGRKRDFIAVAALIGLAWQLHPSAALLGPALLAFVGRHAKRLGARVVLARTCLAAACALGPSLLILPVLMSWNPWLQLADPQSASDWVSFYLGRRYLDIEGGFGLNASRLLSFPRYAWEEFLGFGLSLLLWGGAALWKRNRRLLAGMLLWTLPYATVTILFKIEGQHDCWFIAAWFPFYFAAGLGAYEALRLAGPRAKPVAAALCGGILVWALVANLRDVSQRNYDLAELYGRTLLETADPNAVVVLSGDEGNVLPAYLQRVRGMRRDVTLVMGSFLSSPTASDRYLERLRRTAPTLRKPDAAALEARAPGAAPENIAFAAFLNANAEGGRPLFTMRPIPPDLIRPDYLLRPAGVLWKLVPQSPAPDIEIRYWTFPIEPEDVRPRLRRERGQHVESGPEGLRVAPEAYEQRLIALLLQARFHLALALAERGQFLQAARLCESILAFAQPGGRPEVVHHLGISYHAAGEEARAEPALKRSAEIHPLPESRASALFYLGEIARKRGDAAAAEEYFRRALSTPGVHPAWRTEMERRLGR